MIDTGLLFSKIALEHVVLALMFCSHIFWKRMQTGRR